MEENEAKYYRTKEELEQNFKKGDYITRPSDSRKCIIKVDHFLSVQENGEEIPCVIAKYGLNKENTFRVNTEFGSYGYVRFSTAEEIKALEEAREKYGLKILPIEKVIECLSLIPTGTQVSVQCENGKVTIGDLLDEYFKPFNNL